MSNFIDQFESGYHVWDYSERDIPNLDVNLMESRAEWRKIDFVTQGVDERDGRKGEIRVTIQMRIIGPVKYSMGMYYNHSMLGGLVNKNSIAVEVSHPLNILLSEPLGLGEKVGGWMRSVNNVDNMGKFIEYLHVRHGGRVRA